MGRDSVDNGRSMGLPDGITDAMVDEWKRKYGKVYMVDLCGIVYVYRGLMRSEFKQIAKHANLIQNQVDSNMFLEEQNVLHCVLYPVINEDNINSLEAGTVSVLSSYILEASGFDDTSQPVRL